MDTEFDGSEAMSENFVEIVEVSPRDGIQNEPKLLDATVKIELIRRALAAGSDRIEVTSFVNPKKVPQMADAEAVVAGLPREHASRYIGLVLNQRGYDRALAAGLGEANFVVVASDTFNRRNQGVGTEETLSQYRAIAEAGVRSMRIGVTIGTSFGCPFEGEVPLSRLMAIVEAAVALAPHEIALADTIGVATPKEIRERVGAVRRAFPKMPVRLHLHNTRNTGIANAWAGLEEGVRALDASFGGIGGCPFAPRATGNIATEDLVYMLERSGVSTNVSLDAAIETAQWLEGQLGKVLPGQVMKAGGFPAPIHAGAAA
jgi:hydroxymethylglutaryl-CoA lyase